MQISVTKYQIWYGIGLCSGQILADFEPEHAITAANNYAK
jgi:hypothetical protein